MRMIHKVAAGTAVVLATLGSVPASAGGSNNLTVTATCNTTTGQYDLSFVLDNETNSSGNVAATVYEVDNTDPPKPSFSPNPVPAQSQSSASDSVPGTTTSVFTRVVVSYPAASRTSNSQINPAGDCTASATTTSTTTSTTAAESTTTTGANAPATVTPASPPATPVTASPTFTG